ncbi:putative aldehyde dehydrogenase [Didymella exigua CBS 183.55]|uniref:aldehyde dehydrogenase (NAD(+)) n=1 Tax=Didymella exigua CBS 183.55 TaxID=1150837 RepID=A0A6A5RZ20_9PLEO|nr:putative aldehyde dehydrogenase [Didymella exigua CBS 183.55]KAF1933651.1 putative aldehyde dehydrogenase [Didymella exigua CBS 183.55]
MVYKQLFINNEYVDATSGETLSIYNPHDESLVADGIQVASQEDVDKAVAAARAAFKGEWSEWTPQQRSKAMLKLADLTDKHAEELALWEVKSMGQPIFQAKALYGFFGMVFRYYAGWTDKLPGEAWSENEQGLYKIVQYDPIGVCAGIGAWNGSSIFFAYKTATALAAGCTIIYKASEKSPIGVLQLGQLIKEAGFPPGVLNIVTGDGKVGAALASHMDINKISFTGSAFAGKKVQELAAKSNLKRVTLELGGKSPSLIFPDANLENALTHHSQSFLINSGQACVASSRTFVHEDIAEKFIGELKTRFEQLSHTMGQPTDSNTFLGPLADDKQFERVMSFLDIGKEEAELLTGGARHGDSGWYVQPTIFLNPKDDARIYREEIFGPVLTIRTFKTEEEAIKLANDTSFGLAAYIFTASIPRALRIAKHLDAGNVNINTTQTLGPNVPFGGFKESGIGREGGRQGLMNYVEAKTISINMLA